MALFHFERRVWVHLHWGVLGCMLALTLIGIFAIAGSEMPGAPHAPKQAVWLLLGLVAFALAVALDPRWLRRLAPVAYAALLLALVGLLMRGETIKGSASWYSLGPIPMRFQPSEFMKIAVVLMLVDSAARRPQRWRTIQGLLVPILLAAVPAALIFRQPDFGTAAVFGPILLVVLWLGGARLRHLALFALLAITLAAAVYPHLHEYQRQRLRSFLNPAADIQGRDYNIHQARITLGSGRLWGRTLTGEDDEPDPADIAVVHSRSALDFLPEPHTDFIFASLGEQFGFVGCATVLLLYALLTAFSIALAVQAQSLHGALMVLGLLSIILTHVVFNIGMSLQLMPVTGLPLPFLSYGGSAMLTNFLIGGLICHVGARRFEFDRTRL